MNIELEKYELTDKHYRNSRECIFDKTKDILRILTPEEVVRQKVIAFLQEEMQVPLSAIETEIPVSYYVKGSRGRMDIVVNGKIDDMISPLMVIECKANEIPVTDDVYNQAYSYAEIVDIPFVMVTNGIIADIRYWNEDKKEYEQILKYPKYEELCKPTLIEKFAVPKYEYKRYSYEELYDENTIQQEYGMEIIGDACKRNLVPIFLNIAECFLDDSHILQNLKLSSGTFVRDGGVRFTKFGNSSGESIISRIVSICIG